MQIVLNSYYGEGSGVLDDLLDQEKSCLVVDESDKFLLVGEILSCLAQGNDIHVTFVSE